MFNFLGGVSRPKTNIFEKPTNTTTILNMQKGQHNCLDINFLVHLNIVIMIKLVTGNQQTEFCTTKFIPHNFLKHPTSNLQFICRKSPTSHLLTQLVGRGRPTLQSSRWEKQNWRSETRSVKIFWSWSGRKRKHITEVCVKKGYKEYLKLGRWWGITDNWS